MKQSKWSPAIMALCLVVLAFIGFSAVTTSNKAGTDDFKLEVKGRKIARSRTRRGINLMLSEEYAQSLVDLDRAIRADPSFPEAYLARAVAQLANGKNEAAIADSNKAKALLKESPLDEIAWLQHPNATKTDAERIANRVICIADEVGSKPLTSDEASLLIRLFREFSSSQNCDQTMDTLERWRSAGRAYHIVDRARVQCADLWPRCGTGSSQAPLSDDAVESLPASPQNEAH